MLCWSSANVGIGRHVLGSLSRVHGDLLAYSNAQFALEPGITCVICLLSKALLLRNVAHVQCA